jgi:phenylalanine-4-hydroxylase
LFNRSVCVCVSVSASVSVNVHLSFSFRSGHAIPNVQYTESEIATWRTIFQNLTKLYPTHACKQFNAVFPLLQKHCGYTESNIPQLQQVSDFLRGTYRYLPSKDFLLCLLKERILLFRVHRLDSETCRWSALNARLPQRLCFPVCVSSVSLPVLFSHRVSIFHSTQYIRHHSVPMYTPEPDVCHELLGHVPLFADHDFADFAQQIGIASLGATDEQISLLGTVWQYLE